MGRLRYSLAEAEAEAIRLAEEFAAGKPFREKCRVSFARPHSGVPNSAASKHPVAWVVVYRLALPDGVTCDGGEVFVVVDLESGTVGFLD